MDCLNFETLRHQGSGALRKIWVTLRAFVPPCLRDSVVQNKVNDENKRAAETCQCFSDK